jgi:hypothetical protein
MGDDVAVPEPGRGHRGRWAVHVASIKRRGVSVAIVRFALGISNEVM